jgi:hypothetical protein
MAVLGIITCEILELEFAYLLANDPEIHSVTLWENQYSDELGKTLQHRSGNSPRSVSRMAEYEPETGEKGLDVVVRVLEVGLHSVIKTLREGVVKAALEMEPYVDGIFLGYGLCGNALKNHDELLPKDGVPIFMPMDEDHPVDDCVGLIIGGRENYYEEQCKTAGTMFMNSGFARHWKDIFHKAVGLGKFDIELSKRIMASYERTLLMPTPVLSEGELAEGVEEFNVLYGCRSEVREGTLAMLQESWGSAKKQVMANCA